MKRYLEAWAMKSRTSRTSPTSTTSDQHRRRRRRGVGSPFPTAISHRTSKLWTSSSAGADKYPRVRNTSMKSSQWSRPHQQRLCLCHGPQHLLQRRKKFNDYGELSGRSPRRHDGRRPHRSRRPQAQSHGLALLERRLKLLNKLPWDALGAKAVRAGTSNVRL